MKTILDFEQPISELEKKVAELRAFSSERNVDISHGIELLEERIVETKRSIFSKLSPWQQVQLARHPQRPHPNDYAKALFTDFLELHGDRRQGDDQAIFGGFAKFRGQAVMVIGIRKGRDIKQNLAVNFGSAHPEGYRKACRMMKLADKARIPLICLIDTPGAYPGVAAEERHIGEAIAVNLMEMSRLSIPVVSVVTGEGGSGGALGLALANRILILEHAYYSVITPEGCAAILWRDGSAAPTAAEALKITSKELLARGFVDEVVPEPLGGAHCDQEQAAKNLGESLAKQLAELSSLSAEQLRADRNEKFRNMGVVEQ